MVQIPNVVADAKSGTLSLSGTINSAFCQRLVNGTTVLPRSSKERLFYKYCRYDA